MLPENQLDPSVVISYLTQVLPYALFAEPVKWRLRLEIEP